MIQIIAGGVLFFVLFLVYKRVTSLERDLIISQEALVAERFSRAIDQLGTYKLEIQLGGIFALERIAWDFPKEHWAIMEILTAYIRENAKLESNGVRKIPLPVKPNGRRNGHHQVERAPTDIQAILTVIGRRRWIQQEIKHLKILNLRKCNLPHADLRRAFLERANFRASSLEQANLAEAKLAGVFLGEVNLTGANLANADLTSANLSGANLSGANLKGADLSGANLSGTNLNGASLSKAQLKAANLSQADLRNGNLCGVSLSATNLTNTKLNMISYDYDTIFPDWITQDLKEELRMSFMN